MSREDDRRVQSSQDASSAKPPRRRRYSGTHPRRFEERYKELDPDTYPEIAGHVRSQGRTPAGTHVPIMVEEVLAALQPAEGEVIADVTLGYGGHAEELLERMRTPGDASADLSTRGRLIGLDVDGPQLQLTGRRLIEKFGRERVTTHQSHFAGLPKVLAAEGIDGVDVILADLGLSSMQIDDPRRGFSYKYDGPLDMRMDARKPITAADLVRTMSVRELSDALRDLADEPQHESIAREIMASRRTAAIVRTGALVNVVMRAKGVTGRKWRESKRRKSGGMDAGDASTLHPAARTFQALRILVNDELDGLAQFLRVVPYCLRPGGRIAVLTFHSGEERRVVEAFHGGVAAGIYERAAETAQRAKREERRSNPRSTAARLWWAVRAAGG